jgi:hypothetical protein
LRRINRSYRRRAVNSVRLNARVPGDEVEITSAAAELDEQAPTLAKAEPELVAVAGKATAIFALGYKTRSADRFEDVTTSEVDGAVPRQRRIAAYRRQSGQRLGVSSHASFLPFVAGYYLCCLFRTINALISGHLISDIGLGAANPG